MALLRLSERRRIADKDGPSINRRDFTGRRLELRPRADQRLDHAQVPSRSTRVFSITANASNFDSMVTSTIIGRCTVLQPHLLQFVLKGEFSTEVLFYGAQTTRINTYAIVDCKIKEEWPWG